MLLVFLRQRRHTSLQRRRRASCRHLGCSTGRAVQVPRLPLALHLALLWMLVLHPLFHRPGQPLATFPSARLFIRLHQLQLSQAIAALPVALRRASKLRHLVVPAAQTAALQPPVGGRRLRGGVAARVPRRAALDLSAARRPAAARLAIHPRLLVSCP